MARVVCQVVHRADRVTFVWSEGNAFFEPYSLEGGDSERLEAIAAHARAALARSARSAELAPIGHQLYRAIFRLDAGDGHGAPEIARWLLDLHAKGQVETLEFLGDAPTSIPWNVLYDAQPSGDAPWESFWGGRFNLAAGKRTNPLRLTPPMVKPTAVLAVDAAIVEQVSPPLRSRLDAWGDNRLVIDQAEQLGSRLRSGTPDVLVLLAPVDDGALRIGGQRIMPAQLREWIGAAREGNPNPVIFIGAR